MANYAYNAGTNCLTVTGGTSSFPANFADMYAADVANGWGVVHQYNAVQYGLDCKLQIGDGSTSTYFQDYAKLITFAAGLSYSPAPIMLKANSTFILGQFGSGTRQTYNGCAIIINQNAGGSFLSSDNTSSIILCLYANMWLNIGTSSGVSIQPGTNVIANIWNTNICGLVLYSLGASADLNNLNINKSLYGLENITSNIDNIIIKGCTYSISNYKYSAKFKNIVSSNPGSANIRMDNLQNPVWIIDSILDDWTIVWSSPNVGNLYRQYSFIFLVTDKNGNYLSGAAVILKDKDNNEVFNTTTDENGQITFLGEDSSPENNAVTHTRYYYDAGAKSDYRGPWTLTITASGYQDYQDVLIIDKPMDLEVAMLAPSGAGSGAGPAPICLGLVPLGVKQVAI